MTKILFVCLGNICRSPMAEGLLQKKIQQANQEDRFFVDSAATSSYEVGNRPHPGT
ncbi:phosphotyrosine protein phosphatase [Enterococcus sp. DIV0213j]